MHCELIVHCELIAQSILPLKGLKGFFAASVDCNPHSIVRQLLILIEQ